MQKQYEINTSIIDPRGTLLYHDQEVELLMSVLTNSVAWSAQMYSLHLQHYYCIHAGMLEISSSDQMGLIELGAWQRTILILSKLLHFKTC